MSVLDFRPDEKAYLRAALRYCSTSPLKSDSPLTRVCRAELDEAFRGLYPEEGIDARTRAMDFIISDRFRDALAGQLAQFDVRDLPWVKDLSPTQETPEA